MKIVFRADASAQIGTGHVMRCAALAEALRAGGHDVAFIARELPGHRNDALRQLGFAVEALPAPATERPSDAGERAWLGVPVRQDADETRRACARFAGSGRLDWLVIDHYGLDATWQGALRSHAARILVIDDLADRRHDCELLLDQNASVDGALRYAPHVGPETSLLIGPRYALLRPAFAQLRAKRLADAATSARASAARGAADAGRETQVRAVLRATVFFGGVDAARMTERTLKALHGVDGLAVDVVVGAGNERRAHIERLAASLPSATVHAPGVDFARLLSGADVAFGAGGTTMWERCALGLPAIVVSIAANQEPGCRAAAQAGAVMYLGRAEQVGDAALAHAVELLRHLPAVRAGMSRAAGELVDGLGTERAVRAMEVVGSVTLRRAVPGDRDAMLHWRNDATVRRSSLDRRAIHADGHRRWFDAVLADPRRALLVAEREGQPVGVVRLDRSDTAAPGAVVSIYRAGGQGGGIGTEMLRVAAGWARREWPDVVRLEAEIRADNERSRFAFEQAGWLADRGTWTRTLGAGK